MDTPKALTPRSKHWAVTVESDGERVVTIESNSLCGRDLSAADLQLIRDCAEHLTAFAGPDRSLTSPAPEPSGDTEITARLKSVRQYWDRFGDCYPHDVLRKDFPWMLATIDALRQEQGRLTEDVRVLRRERDGDVWIWQGDDEDHPESLTCPVLMSIDKLRSLLEALRSAREQGWQPIENFGADEQILMWAPAWRLSDRPDHPDDMRISTRRMWTWATMGRALPPAPAGETKGSNQ